MWKLLEGLSLNVWLWAVGVLSGLLLAQGIALWFVAGSRDAAVRDLATCNASIGVAVETNAGNQTVIDDLNKRLGECVGQAQATNDIVAELDIKLAEQASNIAQRVSANQRAREQSYANPSCDALRRLPVCSELDGRLRNPARGDRPDPDG